MKVDIHTLYHDAWYGEHEKILKPLYSREQSRKYGQLMAEMLKYATSKLPRKNKQDFLDYVTIRTWIHAETMADEAKVAIKRVKEKKLTGKHK